MVFLYIKWVAPYYDFTPTSNSLAGVTSNGFTHSFRGSTRLQSSRIFRNILTWANVCFFGTVKQHPIPWLTNGPLRFATFCWWVGFVGLSLRSWLSNWAKKVMKAMDMSLKLKIYLAEIAADLGENHGPTFSRGKNFPYRAPFCKNLQEIESHTKCKPLNSSKHFRQWSSCDFLGNTSCRRTSSHFFEGTLPLSRSINCFWILSNVFQTCNTHHQPQLVQKVPLNQHPHENMYKNRSWKHTQQAIAKEQMFLRILCFLVPGVMHWVVAGRQIFYLEGVSAIQTFDHWWCPICKNL